MHSLSIIIPTWNEEGNIKKLVERLNAALTNTSLPYEIIFIDDHSTDKTQTIVNELSQFYPVSLFLKKGQKGKAHSLIEGFSYAKNSLICMIDADLQYPPEAIPAMIEKIIEGADIVVANRKEQHAPKLRRFLSAGFKKFSHFLFGINQDVQSGLKIFKKEILQTVIILPKSGWTFDLEFLYKANDAGFIIESHDITFAERLSGKSKVSSLKTSLEIGTNALSLRTKKLLPQPIPAKDKGSMQGAGLGFKKRKYITHTTLHHSQSAIVTFVAKQKLFMALLLIIFTLGLAVKTLLTLQIVIGILSFIYFLDVIFNLYIILKSLHFPQEITSTEEETKTLQDKDLPVYSILCPLYKEAHVIPQFVDSITKLDWPKDKLDVMLLLEEDDKESIAAVAKMKLPEYVRSVIVPDSQPKTKPKACNYGLHHAKGEYLVIYDAEDMPDPLQLKKAYLGFQKADPKTICLQAKLNYYNPNQNLLTRFFTAEYSLWFDVTLTGLQSLNSIIPLGGTSNHFKTADLIQLQGWDAFNVTEDADLGIRLFKRGYKTAIIDSVTLEEANSNFKNWLRQRSRWIKGYMQTYLIHTRELFGFKDTETNHSIIFHLTVGGKIAFILINPFLWLATIAYFTLHSIVGPTIEALYPSFVFYMAGTSLVFGNFLFLYYYMIGCVKRGQWSLIKFTYLVPLYWLMISWAGFIAFYQLLFKPHYWEKTIHGLHLKKNLKKVMPEVVVSAEEAPFGIKIPKLARLSFLKRINDKQLYFAGGLLVLAQAGANFLNFLFNAYLGRVLDYDDFAALNLFSVLFSLASIIFSGVSGSVNYKSGFLEGRTGSETASSFWSKTIKQALVYSVVFSAIWFSISPFLSSYFKINSTLPFLLFTPIWLGGFIGAVNRGFLSGTLLFASLAALLVLEGILKLFFAYGLVHLGLDTATYAAIPFASVVTLIIGWMIVLKKKTKNVLQINKRILSFPKKFFLASVLSGLSVTAYMSVDVILAKHFLAPVAAGEYALVSLVGKMVFFLSSLADQFTLSLVSRKEGENKDSSNILRAILFATFGLTFSGFLVFGLLSQFTIPFLLGAKTHTILQYLPIFALGVMYFAMGRVFISYYLPKKIYTFSVVGFLVILMQIILINLYHRSIQDIVLTMTFSGIFNFFLMLTLHLYVSSVKIFESNVKDLFGLFSSTPEVKTTTRPSILIFNWRDTKHVWAGGAETYIHELAKRWSKEGNNVTVFCGNDGKNPRNETIDGVNIFRRGGFYTVYFWAFVYYIFKFRGRYDTIIDSENGIPFFTPLYINKPVFLLIHHIHQEVFREHLVWPLSLIAQTIESKLMPFVYKNTNIITVSESSKEEIIKLGLGTNNSIKIIHPGIDTDEFQPGKKTVNPSLLYLGRLKPYKNIDVAIKAFAKIVKDFPDAIFTIAGFGESRKTLERLVINLNLQNNVIFTGSISEEHKKKLLSESWVMVQPSSIEGWGITVIEANASGTPVIASQVNGLKDSIVDKKTGFLVMVKDVNTFAKAIMHVLNNKKLRSALSKEAALWAENFNWEFGAEKLHSLLTDADKKWQYEQTQTIVNPANNI